MEGMEEWALSGPSSAAFQSMIQLSTSVIPHVILRLEFWFMLGVHLMTWGAYQCGWFQQSSYVASAISVDWVDLKILTLLSIFFLAFHVNQCFQRYLHICGALKRLFACVHDFAGDARLFFGSRATTGTSDGGRAYHHLATRWLASCSLLAVDELRHGTLDDHRWHRYIAQNLVRRSEVDFLRALPGARSRLLAMTHMTAELTKSQLNEEEFLETLQRILSYKELHQELLDLTTLQVPVQYKHLLSLTVFLNLLFLAYGMALSDSTMAPGIFIVMDLSLLGMLDVAQQLWNPFRANSLEFALEEWKDDFRSGLHTILNYQHAGATQQWKQELDEEQRANPNLLAYPQHVERLLEGKSKASAPDEGEQMADPLISEKPPLPPPDSPSLPPLETLQ